MKERQAYGFLRAYQGLAMRRHGDMAAQQGPPLIQVIVSRLKVQECQGRRIVKTAAYLMFLSAFYAYDCE
jgi:hypothetical protein